MKKILIAALVILALGGAWYAFGKGSGASPTNSAQTTNSDVFTENSLGFSFAIPAGFHAQKLLNDSGETILVQSADDTNGFQVYITPFTGSASDIIKQNIEQQARMTVANDSPITVASVAQGLQFDSASDTPPTRQAWFVYQGYLYQAQTWASDAQLLQQILASWKFQS